MTSNFIRSIPKLALAALVATTAAGTVAATQASPAGAQPYHERWRDGYVDVHWHGGYWHGRRYEHRRWHAGYWGAYHVWHPGFWVYF
jgi:hypothetical protein